MTRKSARPPSRFAASSRRGSSEGELRLALLRQEDGSLTVVVDHHRRVAEVEAGRDETLRHPVDARLEVHRGLRTETSQNPDGLHAMSYSITWSARTSSDG